MSRKNYISLKKEVLTISIDLLLNMKANCGTVLVECLEIQSKSCHEIICRFRRRNKRLLEHRINYDSFPKLVCK